MSDTPSRRHGRPAKLAFNEPAPAPAPLDWKPLPPGSWLGKVSTSTDGIIHVGLSRQEDIEAPHFEQIARRQTNRRCYNGSMISDNALALLRKTPVEPGIGIHLFQKGTQAFDDIATLVYEGNRRQMGNPAFKAELRQWKYQHLTEI